MDVVGIFPLLTRAVMADIARREIGDLLARSGLLRRQLEGAYGLSAALEQRRKQ
jgi:hypothetical protein